LGYTGLFRYGFHDFYCNFSVFLYQQKIQKNQIELLDRNLHSGYFPFAMGGVGGGNFQHPFRGKLIIKAKPPQGELYLVFEIAEPFFGINR
jgi:hypothetical protein